MTFEEVMDKVVASASRQYVMRAANLETLKLMTCGGVYISPPDTFLLNNNDDEIQFRNYIHESIPTSNIFTVKLNLIFFVDVSPTTRISNVHILVL
jgi:hypothetical protein